MYFYEHTVLNLVFFAHVITKTEDHLTTPQRDAEYIHFLYMSRKVVY